MSHPNHHSNHEHEIKSLDAFYKNDYKMRKHKLIKHLNLICILFFLLLSFNSYAYIGPELSIVTDKAPGNPVNNGLNKLIDALKAKGIPYEKASAVNRAKGKVILVAGLSTGEG